MWAIAVEQSRFLVCVCCLCCACCFQFHTNCDDMNAVLINLCFAEIRRMTLKSAK